MSNFKRAPGPSKSGTSGRHGGKPKDASKLMGARKSIDLSLSPESECRLSLPVVKLVDNNRILPRYTAVLSRTAEDGVGMEDLDQLQQDLEKLLSTAAVRHRLMKSEIESLDRNEERRKNKKGQLAPPSKRKRLDDKGKYKEMKNTSRLLKTRTVPVSTFLNELPIKREVPKVIFPKNDTFDKFWLSVEPYCANVNKDVVAFLDELIQECSQDVDIKIPEVGEHYSMDWSEELLGHERFLNNAQRSVKTKNMSFSNELKRNGLNAMVDTFSSPLTQRLLAALLEEKVVTKLPTVTEKLKPSDFGVHKMGNYPKTGVCMDRRLKKELVEQGILDVEDLSTNIPPDDDILIELKRCVEELRVVNEKNVTELSKLRTIVAKDLRRQDVKDALDKVDDQVMELYNNILVAKQKQSSDDDESYSKMITAKQTMDEYEDESNRVIRQQIILHKELTELTNAIIPL